MLSTLIIVFREILEAALVVGIVMAASRGVPRRGAWIVAGCAGGVLGALLVAAFANQIAALMHGVGQELFTALILLAAVAMLSWHSAWMSRHGRELSRQATQLGKDVALGTRPLYALALVCGIAVLREGSELVLFLYGVAASGSNPSSMAIGGGLGLAAGAAMGLAIYFGLLAVPMRHVFFATTWLIVLLAAGMAAQSAAFLTAADVLPSLGSNLWDTSSLVSESSVVGQVLHVLVGYTARPMGIQLVFFAGTLLIIGALIRVARVVPRAPAALAPAHRPT